MIQEAGVKGATHVRFPGGELAWPGCCNLERLPEKETYAILRTTAAAATSEVVAQWLEEHQVKCVQIHLDAALPASTFFKIERLLHARKIRYYVIPAERGRLLAGSVQLFESLGDEDRTLTSEVKPPPTKLLPVPVPAPRSR